MKNKIKHVQIFFIFFINGLQTCQPRLIIIMMTATTCFPMINGWKSPYLSSTSMHINSKKKQNRMKMGFNAKKISFCLCRMIHVLIETSFTYRKAPTNFHYSLVSITFWFICPHFCLYYHFFKRIFGVPSMAMHLEFIKWDKKKNGSLRGN